MVSVKNQSRVGQNVYHEIKEGVIIVTPNYTFISFWSKSRKEKWERGRIVFFP